MLFCGVALVFSNPAERDLRRKATRWRALDGWAPNNPYNPRSENKMVTELKRIIDQVSREKGIDREVLISTLEDAVKAAAKKKMGPSYDLEVSFNEEIGEIEVFEFKEVVEEVTDEHLQVSVDEAHDIDPESEIGDSLGIKMDTDLFGRIAAQSAKQVIMQRLREAERNLIYDDYKDRRGEIIHGIVQRFDKGSIIVNLGRTEADLPVKEQIPKESYKQGDRVRAYILDVRQFSRGPQIILSRTHPNFLSALFENEVPEISETIVSVVQVAREPGSRAKIAVSSKDSDVDPVGACVGMKGSRVQAVVQELRGEKIDIVPWDDDPAKFVCNALAPAEITRVVVDEDNQPIIACNRKERPKRTTGLEAVRVVPRCDQRDELQPCLDGGL